MAISTGDMAQQEATSRKGRSADRDLEQLIYGFIQDRGRVMRSQRRFKRIDRYEHVPDANHEYMEKDIHGNAWRSVDHVYFIGFMLTDEEYERLFDRLEMLRAQVAQIVDFHDENVFDRLVAAEVNTGSLGGLGAQLGDQLISKYSFAKLWDDA